MKKLLLLATLAVGLGASSLMAAEGNFARISFVAPGPGNSTVDPSQFVTVIVEGPYITHDKTPLLAEGEVEYLDKMLKNQGASYIAVHIRQGVKYGDVIRALDTLRRTTAKNIGVSMIEVPASKDI